MVHALLLPVGRWILLVLICIFPLQTFAQTNDEFEDFRKGLQTEYNDFRKEINAEYSELLSEAWKEYRLFRGKLPDENPKPLFPAFSQEEKNAQAIHVVADEIVARATNSEVVEKEHALKDTFWEKGMSFDLDYFGARLQMRHENKPFFLPSIVEQSVGKLWKEMADSKFTLILADMLRCKEAIQMNDWAYFLLVKMVAAQLSTLHSEDCRTVYQHFLLVQSGYDVRLARIDRFLVLLFPIREEVYTRHYMEMDGKQYYVFSEKDLNAQSTIFTYQLPEKLIEKPYLSLAVTKELLLPMQPRSFCVKAAGLEVKGEVNVNKARFYMEYPLCELSVYARAVPAQKLSKQLVASLSAQLAKKPLTEALNQLLSWVQSGFRYQTDSKQFGREKPFFIEENFYYSASDCEDRSILFAYLVKQLWGKETVLLDYPGHVATAVYWGEQELKGVYVQLQGKKYIVCDPTYMNAKAGQVIPACKAKHPKVIKL